MNDTTPEIDGYEFLQPLGAGGFADVALYEQEMPRRAVAVKVLRAAGLTPDSVRTFQDEANLMAQLSAHPAIVTVYSSGLLADGRPFLVMEHCPRGNLGQRFRTAPFGVEEALAVGVQIAGAVETAHRAGVLHRDIKPANVLVTSFGRPALSDFGIAATLGAAAAGDALGMSVPWSPPEILDGSWSGPATDVYMLGATVFSLLAGHAPFETGGDDSAGAQSARIRAEQAPPTGRADVPASLERALATALSRSPQGRFTSALSFARSLQKVQRELGLPVSTVDVLDSSFHGTGAGPSGDDGLTLHPVGLSTTGAQTGGIAAAHLTGRTAPPSAPVYIAPAAPAAPGTAATEPVPTAAPTAPVPAADHTMLRAPSAAPVPSFAPPPSKPRSPVPGIVLDVVLVLAVAGAAAALVLV